MIAFSMNKRTALSLQLTWESLRNPKESITSVTLELRLREQRTGKFKLSFSTFQPST